MVFHAAGLYHYLQSKPLTRSLLLLASSTSKADQISTYPQLSHSASPIIVKVHLQPTITKQKTKQNKTKQNQKQNKKQKQTNKTKQNNKKKKLPHKKVAVTGLS